MTRLRDPRSRPFRTLFGVLVVGAVVAFAAVQSSRSHPRVPPPPLLDPELALAGIGAFSSDLPIPQAVVVSLPGAALRAEGGRAAEDDSASLGCSTRRVAADPIA